MAGGISSGVVVATATYSIVYCTDDAGITNRSIAGSRVGVWSLVWFDLQRKRFIFSGGGEFYGSQIIGT